MWGAGSVSVPRSCGFFFVTLNLKNQEKATASRAGSRAPRGRITRQRDARGTGWGMSVDAPAMLIG